MLRCEWRITLQALRRSPIVLFVQKRFLASWHLRKLSSCLCNFIRLQMLQQKLWPWEYHWKLSLTVSMVLEVYVLLALFLSSDHPSPLFSPCAALETWTYALCGTFVRQLLVGWIGSLEVITFVRLNMNLFLIVLRWLSRLLLLKHL